MYIDNEASIHAHREIWGWPAKMGKFKYTQKDNRFKATVKDGKTPLMKFDVNVEGPGEFIDTGASINVKLIPSVDGKGYDVNQITTTGIQITVHEGLAGDGKLTLYNSDADPLADLIQVESVVAGMWFNIDMHVPFGQVIGEAEL
jgi:acetoacetate decarboxylase